MWGAKRIVALGGTRSNTFTGMTSITGKNILRLKKTNGAVAISRNLDINNGATVELHETMQITRNARVVLRNVGNSSVPSELVFKGKHLTESIHQLVVEGTGQIDFGNSDSPSGHRLYLDDLEIKDGGRLIIKNWRDGWDSLRVHKDSTHLQDALSKIDFEGEAKWVNLVKEGDYYAIIAKTPEPATYGASVIAVGLVAFVWRRRRSHSRLRIRS